MERTSKCDMDVILKELNRMEYYHDDTGVKMAVRQSTPIRPNDFIRYPMTWKAIMEIGVLLKKTPTYFMANRLPGDCRVPKHTDTLIRNKEAGKIVITRWHLPVITNPDCRYWEDGFEEKGIYLPAGRWFGPIQYWKDHAIWNDSHEERVHLVVDLE